MHDKGADPGNAALEKHNLQGPPLTKLSPDGGNGCNTRCVEQAEHQEGGCSCRSQHLLKGCCASKKNTKGGDNALLSQEAGNQRGHHSPVAEAERLEDRSDQSCKCGQDTLGGIADHGKGQREGLKEPDDQRGKENDGEGSLDKVPGFLPEKLADILGSRHPVGREFHDERNGFALVVGIL